MGAAITMTALFLVGLIIGFRLGLGHALERPAFARGFIQGFGFHGLRELIWPTKHKDRI